MKDWIKNKPFIFGFVIGIFLFILANIYFAFVNCTKIDFGVVSYGHSFDGYSVIGFPFPVYERWANSTFDFYWISIFANIFIAIIFSILVGWLFKFILLRLISKDTKCYSQNTFYNKAFKLGFWTNILLFLVLNYLSYLTAYNNYHAYSKIQFSVGGYVWGFPFVIYKNLFGYPNNIGFVFEGIVLNAFVTIVCGFIVGSIFKFIWSKFQEKPLK